MTMDVKITVEKKYTITVAADVETWKDVIPILTDAITGDKGWTIEQRHTINTLRQALADKLREAGAW